MNSRTDTPLSQIVDSLAERIERLGWTRYRLAHEAGLTVSTLQRMSPDGSWDPRLSTLLAVEQAVERGERDDFSQECRS